MRPRKRRQERLSDLNAGSVLVTLLETVAEELARTQEQLKEVYESDFVETAKGSALIGALAVAAGIAFGIHLGRRSCVDP